MSSENTASNFERAARLKLRFETPAGHLSVEDLWDLPLISTRVRVSLDDVARSLHRSIKEAQEESFVIKPTTDSEKLQLGFEIVKHIIEVRMAENEEERVKAENRRKKQRVLEILAQKRDGELSGKSVEELEELAATL
jgi:hypothetical protein